MSSDGYKLLIGAALLAMWVALVVFKVPDAGDLIAFAKIGLTGLASHYLTYFSAPDAPPASAAPAATLSAPALVQRTS